MDEASVLAAAAALRPWRCASLQAYMARGGGQFTSQSEPWGKWPGQGYLKEGKVRCATNPHTRARTARV